MQAGNLLYVAGTITLFNGKMTHTGQVGKEQTVPAAYEAAKICALNTLAYLKAATGTLDSVKQFVLVTGFVNAVSGFADSPSCINGASELFAGLYGDAGKHARAAIAVTGLPKNSTVEIQVTIELKETHVTKQPRANSLERTLFGVPFEILAHRYA